MEKEPIDLSAWLDKIHDEMRATMADWQHEIQNHGEAMVQVKPDGTARNAPR
jgi:hypothetical protein